MFTACVVTILALNCVLSVAGHGILYYWYGNLDSSACLVANGLEQSTPSSAHSAWFLFFLLACGPYNESAPNLASYVLWKRPQALDIFR